MFLTKYATELKIRKGNILTHYLLKWPHSVVCSKITEPIYTKLDGEKGNGPQKNSNNFGADPNKRPFHNTERYYYWYFCFLLILESVYFVAVFMVSCCFLPLHWFLKISPNDYRWKSASLLALGHLQKLPLQ